MNKFFRYEDIMKIDSFLRENDYLDYDIEIVNKVPDVKTLNRVNDDYFYRLNNGENEKPNEDMDEVVINIGNVKIIYKVEEGQ